MRILGLIFCICILSCQQPQKTDIKNVKTNSIQAGPIRHETLSPELLERIEKVHKKLYEVEGIPLAKCVENFKRDLHPEPNIIIWEQMAEAYISYCSSHEKLSLGEKKEVYKVILMRSMISTEDVLKRLELKHLSIEESKNVLALYSWKPVPLTVVKK